MKTQEIKSTQHFLIGFNIIGTLFCCLFLSSVLFIFEIPISVLHFYAALVMSGLLTFFACRGVSTTSSIKLFVKVITTSIAVIIISLLISSFFYDMSFDGQSYHQEILLHLFNGFNPVYYTFPDNAPYYLWINNYAKGAEIIAATIYAAFGWIEIGKSINLMLLAASFFLLLAFFERYFYLKKIKTYLISLLIALNPIVIVQSLTYYVDGFMASALISLLVCCLILFRQKDNLALLLLIFLSVIILNIKFTATGFVAIILLGLLAALLYKREFAQLRIVFIATVIAVSTGACIVGFNPYMKNLRDHQHPFYPVAGKGKVEVVANQYPNGFQEKNRLKKLFISLYARTDDSKNKPELKVPLSFKKSELLDCARVDTRIGGFGIFFSAIFSISFMLFIFCCIYKKTTKANYINLAFLLGTLIISILIIPDPWMARYIPQLWLIPIILLVFIEICYHGNFLAFIRNFVYILIILNIFIITSIYLSYNLVLTIDVNNQLRILKKQSVPVKVDFEDFKANKIRFEEHNIPYKQVSLSPTNDSVYYIYSISKTVMVCADGIPPTFNHSISQDIVAKFKNNPTK